MAPSSFSLFLWFFFLFLFLAPPMAAHYNSIYEVLSSRGLPKGLLPKGITDYEIDDGSGRFVAFLDRECNAKFENQLHYETNVSGTLSYGQIGALSGISAQDLFLWFPVKGIRVDVPSSGVIYFDVGVVFKQFSQSIFESPPECVAVQSGFVSPNSKNRHRKIGSQFVESGLVEVA